MEGFTALPEGRLADAYDYFALRLADVCSGCLQGCRFCGGVCPGVGVLDQLPLGSDSAATPSNIHASF
ncbi:unnamed protein product [Protopolystoma xenopodis]|uniref:4Fe-4S ferredoxin-type domain-containing protein n=1 Tax=Protopolystoma xenopodis TaxID=117903 RepID=A0A3S5AQY0_9PLAT|nr:unnamed protein product [Protopolystoma xenopodis]